MMLVCYITALCVLRFSSCFPLQDDYNKDHTVIVFAFSGLRWDFLKNTELRAFKHLLNHGAIARRKIDAFQTESLPSFTTLVTGLHPESHGMMANKMKDRKSGELFDVKNTDLKWWKNVEPVWVTNSKNGSYSALCYWPGFDANHKGNKTKYYCSKEHTVDPFKELLIKEKIHRTVMSFEERLEKVKTWLQLKNERPTFIGVYFEEPLKSMMEFGLDSTETKIAFQSINNVTQAMIDFLREHNKFESYNFIVTGESGVTELKKHQEIYLQDYFNDIDVSKYTIVDDGPIMNIFPKRDQDREYLLKKWTGAHKHITVYNGDKLPKSFHYTNENLTAPIIIVADETWRLYDSRVVDNKKALMGFDSKFSSAHSLFLAHGPAFKNIDVDAIGNVDVYAMLCEALKIKPHPHSGNKTTIDKFMKRKEKWYVTIVKKVTNSTTGLTVAIIVAVILLFIALYLIIAAIYKTIGWCSCAKYPLKVKIKSPGKSKKGNGGQHLLSDDEVSSDACESDEDFGIRKK